MTWNARSNSAVAAVVFAAIGVVSPGNAADLPVKADGGPVSGPAPMAVGGWLFSPTLFAGAAYNSNINQTNTGRVSGWGERVVPGFTANVASGVYQTNLYGIADVQNYSQSGVAHQTTVDAKAGITETYLATRDLTIRANADYTRQADVFGSSAFAAANTTLAPTSSAPVAPVTISPQANPDRYNQFSGALAADQRFGRGFGGLSVNAVSTVFDSNSAFITSRDGTVYTVAGRLGYDLTPQVYGFVDPQADWQRYRYSVRNSNGYRVTGGLGTSAAGLWRGEVYGGYQTEKNDVVGSYNSGVYGFRVGYSPTRMWNLTASLDESLGAASVTSIGTTGIAARVTTGLLSVGYNGLPRGWGANARFGYVQTSYINLARKDNGWLAGANVSYEVWRNLSLTLDYQYKAVTSDVGPTFNQQVVSAGVSYKY